MLDPIKLVQNELLFNIVAAGYSMSQNTYFVLCVLRTYVLYVLRTNVQQNIAAFVRFLFYVESTPANANPHQGRFFSEE